MTQPEILDEMLTGVPDEYDTSEQLHAQCYKG